MKALLNLILQALLLVLVSSCTDASSPSAGMPQFSHERSIVSEYTGITLTYTPYYHDTDLARLSLTRDGDVLPLIMADNEYCESMVVSAATNLAYLLIKKYTRVVTNQIDGRVVRASNFTRIDQLLLPERHQPLEEYERNVLIDMNDLRGGAGSNRSWVSSLLNVSDDGNLLYVKKAYPVESPIGSAWTHLPTAFNVVDKSWSLPNNEERGIEPEGLGSEYQEEVNGKL
jgi:hypothetical protein